ncbi:DUF5302 family protein [Ammonicoccus fulvus]|uniref:DUF5302 family protein n=1 Tax=Ammonicoccus fulvus TaxID=3138240 RepID=A0ABZ3FLU2_9ACTN
MSDDKANEAPDAVDPKEAPDAVDPKEAMRQALERKKQGAHGPGGHGDHHRNGGGKAHGPAAGRREFRRKAGG